MGAGKQPRFAAALHRLFRSTRYSPSIQQEMRFRSCLAAGSHQRTICLRPPGLRGADKAERDDSPVGLSREPAPHLSFGIAGGIIPQELA